MRVRRLRSLAIAAAGASACVALVPAASPAATVELAARSAEPFGSGWASIDYRAAPGEANRVVLTKVDDFTIRVDDPGAAITAGQGCRTLDAHSAECTVAGLPDTNGLIAANVFAGDLDDTVESRGPGLSGNGGPGDDRLESSSIVAGSLDGGGGRDTLLGGTNRDTLTDGDTSGAADADVLDGARRRRDHSYASRIAPVRVDISDPGPDGEPGEGDTIRGATGITGGGGADVLRGDRRPNLLSGGAGDDVISGGGGDDFIEGGDGADRLLGQAGADFAAGNRGDDELLGGTGGDLLDGGRGGDRLRGGAGQDLLRSGASRCGGGSDAVTPARNDFVARDCEQGRFDLRIGKSEIADQKGVTARPYPSVRDGVLVFRVQCPYRDLDGSPTPLALRGSVRIRGANGRLLGAGRVPRSGARCARSRVEGASRLPIVRVRAALNATGRAELARRGTTRLRIRFAGRNVPPVPWTISL